MCWEFSRVRTLPKNSDIIVNIRGMPLSPLILISQDGKIVAGSRPKEKDEIYRKFNPSGGDVLLFAWAGNNRTDVFRLTWEDLQKHYDLDALIRDS